MIPLSEIRVIEDAIIREISRARKLEKFAKETRERLMQDLIHIQGLRAVEEARPVPTSPHRGPIIVFKGG